jgi:VIT1/CCC1 family predicted Fe2+/Mn2+ transporter
MRAYHLYLVLAEVEAGGPREALFRNLAKDSLEQAGIWAERSAAAGVPVAASFAPDARTRLVAALVRRLGPRAMKSVLAAMKVRGLSVYTSLHPLAPGHSQEAEDRRHKSVAAGGNLRAAVFGVNDGLVSNAGLILGVAGATSDPAAVLLAGTAGMLAGAFSMAAGEYISVRAQREVFEYQIGLERQELAEFPDEEAAELAAIYAARGMPKEQARAIARELISNPERALDALAREELGLDPEQLASPWGASSASFLAFSVGAAIPLAPYLLGLRSAALPVAVLLTALSLFGVGATISLFTGRDAIPSGLRMLGIGMAAGAISYAIGAYLGVSFA